jgi:DAK2 domain fusion protein YloV
LSDKKKKTKEIYNGKDFFQLLQAATSWLEKNAEFINSLNVFPVPDGDTGTNMVLTLKTALRESEKTLNESIEKVTKSIAYGALLGARGNSGVILSQYLSGLAQALEKKEFLDSSNLPNALTMAAQSARKAMNNPVEGTMITVARVAGEASKLVSTKSFSDQLMAAAKGAEEAVERTPDQLDILKKAGVVDSGGKGLALILRAAANHHMGIDLGPPTQSIAPISIDPNWLSNSDEDHWGFCTEFVLVDPTYSTKIIRKQMERFGDSESFVEGENILRVHLHSHEPEEVIMAANDLGELEQVAIRDMDQQQKIFIADHQGDKVDTQTGLVSVVTGPGLLKAMRTLGASAFIWGSRTMNPSTEEILEAIESIPYSDVIVLPNNKNTIAACEMAKQLTKKRLEIVPTESMTQGIASLISFLENESIESNLKRIKETLDGLKWGEVTEATRSGIYKNISYSSGDIIGFSEGVLVTASKNPVDCVINLLEHIAPESESICTLYYGSGAEKQEVKKISSIIESNWPEVELELIDGGHPIYRYMLAIEA